MSLGTTKRVYATLTQLATVESNVAAITNNGESTFNAATKQGTVICKGAGNPVAGAWALVQVGVSGVDRYQIATILIGGTGTPGNIWQRFSSDSGATWGTWTLINS